MKALALALLAVNIGVSAYFLLGSSDPGQPVVEIAPERFDLAKRADAVSPPKVADAAPSELPKPVVPAGPVCMTWRGFDEQTFAAAREQLKKLADETRLSFNEVPEQTRSWVVYPPLANAAEANRKIAEFGEKGIKDLLRVRDGKWQNGVSMGLYATEESAQRRLAEIEKKGIRGAMIERIPRLHTPFYFVIKSESAGALDKIETFGKAYPGSRAERSDCPS